MTSDDLRTSLRQPYDRQTWTTLLRRVFGKHVRLESQPRSVSTGDDEAVRSIAQIGSVTLDDGRNLAVIEVEVSDSIMLLRNRVSLRNKVARFIDEDRAHGVLAVFSSSRPEYRFSFTARETIFDEQAGIVEKETATKRFTYVLGPGETCTTAAQRFEQLSTKRDSLNLGDVVEAFSVEKLNKEFFSSYREHYLRFCNHLLGDEARAQTYRIFGIRQVSIADEQARLEKPVRDFVKRLLGRIVFLHFIQKKGWMGCPADSHCWGGGDPDFLRNYFHASTDKAAFHSGRLLPLFYEALNTPGRPHDVYAHTGTRIPYLNGGLFEAVIPGEREINFPSDYFEALLDFFAQYNFTIDENDPDEHEVGIDPEMLGHIFENLLEDNKDKGAYYTPKAIVHYMCQQSLIYYLITHLGDTEESREAVEFLVRNKQVGEGTPHESYIRRNAARIETLLDTVKICDPAIGSGAFPIGLLQEIFWLKLTLDLTLNEPSRLAEIKRRIIQNSIYGVDKDAGAVSIARLRFWLSLVVDEEAPQPLPNLDFKIMQGDSLLESFEGIPLDQFDPESMGAVSISPQAQLEMDFASSQLPLASDEKVNRITELMRAYFTEDAPAEKVRLHGEIDRFVLDHIEFNLNYRKDELETELHQHRAEIAEKQKQLASFQPTKKEAKRMEWLQSGIAEIDRKKRQLSKLETEPERPYFLWHLFFQDVLNEGGFDIVIANPPYVRQEVIKDYKPLLEAEGYDCYTGTADLFVYFYERSLKLLNERGILTFITSNKYYRSGYGEGLRKLLAQNLRIREMLDFGDAPVFDAIAYASILVGSKEPPSPDHALKAWTWERGEKINLIARVMKDRAFPLDQANLTSDGWRLERPEVFALLNKLRSKGTPLGEYVKGRFYRGILTGLNEAFVVDRATRDRLIREDPKSEEVLKPFLRGRDVKRWKANPQDLWLVFIPWHFPLHLNPEIKGASAVAEKAFKEQCPAIFNHLHNFKEALESRNKAETGIRYEWYALQRWGSEYWQEFEQPKVAYPDIYEHQSFAFVEKGVYLTNTAYFIPTEESWLCASLNSNVSEWHYRCLSNTVRGGFLRAFSETMQHLPIPPASDQDKKRLSELVQSATTSTSRNDPSSLKTAETEINRIVYRLFDLTPDEIRLIESSLATESQSNPTTESWLTE